jgi:sulfur carrier protein ThiS
MLLHLGGHLSYFDVQNRTHIDLKLETPTRLVDILTQLGIPFGEIYLVIVNDEVISLQEANINPGDKVEVFPPMGGG